jgi:guanylate kinase
MNELVNLQKFQNLLANYQLSKAALQTLSQTQLVLLVAPTSSGRNHLIRELMKTGDYYYIVSDTTRRPRTNDGVMEQSGVEYWFRDEQSVLEDIKGGKYLEAAVIHQQQVSGISIRELQQATDQGKIAITDAEIAGIDNAIKLKPDTLGIFVLPPSFDEWQRRLHHRGDMHPEEYKRRMESALGEFSAALERPYYKFVINDDVSDAVQQINAIAKLDTYDEERQAAARHLAEQLLLETQILLRSL